jgi:hypothetical protein
MAKAAPFEFICFMADAVKILILSIPKRKHDFSAIDHES